MPAELGIDTAELAAMARRLRRCGDEAAAEVRAQNADTARTVTDDAQRRLARHPNPILRHVARTQMPAGRGIAPARSAVRPGVRVTPARGAGMSLGAEFGAKRYQQFPPYTTPRWGGPTPPTGGYGVLPAIRAGWERILEGHAARLRRAARRRGVG